MARQLRKVSRVFGGRVAAIDRAASIKVAVAHLAAPHGSSVVAIAGELDTANVDMVRRQLDPLLSGEPTMLVFDLSGLTFMDSSGIALFVDIAERVGSISLRNVSSLVQRVLERVLAASGAAELFGLEQ